MNRVNLISLFSGAGGSDLGCVGGFEYLDEVYEPHPVNIVSASDIDQKCVDTYNANQKYFSEQAVCNDIRDINLSPFQSSEVLVGGFPCQAFSTVNPTKSPEQKETQLFWEMAEVVAAVRPKVFVAENVKGFYLLSDGKYFRLAKETFESHGYRIYHKVLNSAHYGVPQLRERLFIIGVRNDVESMFIFPEPTHGEGFFDQHKPRVLGDVINALDIPEKKYYFSERAVEGARNAKPNMKRLVHQDLAKPCLTITRHLAKVSINSRDPVLLVDESKDLYRRFTPREASDIQSFPKDFVFMGSEGDAYRQIGNAIPPVLMWHIMKNILEQVLHLGGG